MSSATVEVGDITALNVPLKTQVNQENRCLHFSMEMVLQYCKANHPSKKVNEGTTLLTAEELEQYIRARTNLGWAPTPKDFEAISTDQDFLEFSLKYWVDTPQLGVFYEIIEDRLEANMPTIAIVDSMRLAGIDTDGAMHAVVVTGIGPQHVLVNNPWGEKHERYKRQDLLDAWDTQLNRIITVEGSTQSSINGGNSGN